MMRIDPERRKRMLHGMVVFVLLVWFVGTTCLLLSVDASGASAVTVEVQWCLFCLLEVKVEESEQRKTKKILLVLWCCWILGLVFWFVAIPISRYQWIEEVDAVKVVLRYV